MAAAQRSSFATCGRGWLGALSAAKGTKTDETRARLGRHLQ